MENIQFKVNEKELKSLRSEAEKREISMSDLIRGKIFIDVGIEDIIKKGMKEIENIIEDAIDIISPKPKKTKKKKDDDPVS